MEHINLNNIIDIITRAKAGDKEAFSQLYEEYYTPVYKYIYYRSSAHTQDEAEDVAQEVFLKAYTSFDTYSYVGKSPLAYFYTIARNILIDRGRKKRVKIERLDLEEKTIEEIPDGIERIDEQLMRKEDTESLHANISQLSPDQQDVIIFRFIDGMSTSEIAKILKRSEVAIRQLQSKGLKSLRKILNTHE